MPGLGWVEEALTDTVGDIKGFTMMPTLLDWAMLSVAQTALLVIETEMESLLAEVEVE